MTVPKIAVLMSVYSSDDVGHLEESLNSVFNQVGVEPYIYLQVDGPVPEHTRQLIYSCVDRYNLFPTWHETNLGLAQRLNNAIDIALKENFEFIARMDADDVCADDRFIKQVKFFYQNSRVSVLGTDVIEFSEGTDEVFYKKMAHSHELLSKDIIKKCPFNHPSVMFRTLIFKEGFRYKSELKNTQDYYLWVDLLAAGKQFANINEPLLSFRVNDKFHSRRGFKKAINDLNSRRYAFKKLNVLTPSNAFHTAKLFFLRLAPKPIKIWAYKNFR